MMSIFGQISRYLFPMLIPGPMDGSSRTTGCSSKKEQNRWSELSKDECSEDIEGIEGNLLWSSAIRG